MQNFQSLFLFALLAISTSALDQCPQDVQTIDVLDPEKVPNLRITHRISTFKDGFHSI